MLPPGCLKWPRSMPDAVAVVEPLGYDRQGKRQISAFHIPPIGPDSDRIAQGLRQMGVVPGTRLALLVRPGIDFISLVFALLKAGAVSILIDPGMGRGNLIQCLAEAEPEGFVAIPMVHAVRILLRRKFPKAKFNVTVGRRWFWGGPTLEQLRAAQWTGHSSGAAHFPMRRPWPTIRRRSSSPPAAPARPRACSLRMAISTPRSSKSATFRHPAGRNRSARLPAVRAVQLRDGRDGRDPRHGSHRGPPGSIRPKSSRPPRDWNVTQAFGSPAIWNRVGRYCEEHKVRLPTVRRVLSAGAPVPVEVLRRMKACIHEGDIHTPYGATEALPVASISASEVLGETAEQTRQGAGVCVGRKFPGIEWKVIRIVDGPIASIERHRRIARRAKSAN